MLPIDFKSYLLYQTYDYIVDRGLTPYIQVFVNQYTDVPMEFVLNHSITLNILFVPKWNLALFSSMLCKM